MIGMDILWDFEKDGDEYENGRIIDSASGEIYVSKMWLTNEQTLQVRGYAGPFNLFFRTQTWKLEKADHDQNPFTGTWKSIDDYSGKARSLVEIYEQNGKLKGRVTKIILMNWEREAPICINCPEEKKNQKIVGMTILDSFKKSGEQWLNGNIMGPGNGKIYSSILWMTNVNILNVRGYTGPFFRTQTWKRFGSLAVKNEN